MANVTFEIKAQIAVLSVNAAGWSKELNLVSWNNGTPKLDIREWSADHQRMGKGITLTDDEAKALIEGLQSADEKISQSANTGLVTVN